MADKEANEIKTEKQPVPPAPQEGLVVQDANDIVALLDRLFEMGGVKGNEALRVGQLRTKLVALIKTASENA